MTLVIVMVLVLAALPVVIAPPPAHAFAPIPGYSELDWNRVASRGISDGANGSISTLQVYDGALYAGTYNLLGCNLYRYDGTRWEMLVGEGLPTFRSPGFGNSENDTITTMAVFEGALYMGTFNEVTGCELWRHDGTDYQKLVGVGRPGVQAPGFGDADNYSISAMASMGEYLYLGTYNQHGCELWRYDGATFEQYDTLGPGFGDADNRMVRCMAVYDNALYMGTQNVPDGCEIWRWSGTAMTQLVGQDPAGTFGTGPGFGNGHNGAAASMAEHRGNLYVGTVNSDGCEVWSYAGAGWAKVAGPGLLGNSGAGFGDTGNTSVFSLASYGSFLYAGTHNITGEGSQVWRTDVSGWSAEADGGLGNPFNNPINAMCEYGSALYAATSNWPEGGEVYSAAHNFYFAEGYTGTGFQEYLCLGNPEHFDASATITFMFEDGSSQRESLTVPEGYRATVDVNGTVGAGRNVSALVQCDRAIAVERPMYFDYTPTLNAGHWTGGHDAVGATSLSNYWYFAEGYTGPGFEEWICILNPGDQIAHLTFRFQVEGMEDPIVHDELALAPHSRGSLLINEFLGTGYQTSLALESSQPVVAERPMYFDYLGADPAGPRHWTGGHCVMGVPVLSNRYYFAEGCTRGNFEEYLTIQNPGIMPITVDAVYQPAAGQGDNVEASYTLMPGTRHTVFVPSEAGEDKDLSVQLTSAGPFLAERPMYFDYTGFGAPGWTGGHCVIGATDTAAEWFFAEGYTGPGFQEWLTLQNPGDDDAVVRIDYFTQEEGPLEARTVTVPARARLNVWVNESAGEGYQLSARLRVTEGPEIVAERPMYFAFGPAGWTGGHDVVGLIP